MLSNKEITNCAQQNNKVSAILRKRYKLLDKNLFAAAPIDDIIFEPE